MPLSSSDLDALALKPAAASSDAGSVTAHSLPDVIEADKYAAAKTALTGTNANGGSKSLWGTLRPMQAKPPGGV